MAFEITIDADRKLRITTFTGVVTDDVMIQAFQAVRAFDPTLDSLADFSPAERMAITPEGVRQLSRLVLASPLASSRRVAIVAPTDIGFGISRIFAAVTGDTLTNLRVFRDHAEAIAWLRSPIVGS